MRHLPVFFDVQGRKVVVLGDGIAAERRRELVRGAGGEPVETFDGAAVAFVVGDEAAARDARAAGVPVNVMDRPELSDFIMPAIVERGPVTVAISTGGASPTLAQWLRTRIEAVLPERLGEIATTAQRLRGWVKATLADPQQRRAFWRRLIATGDADAALRQTKEAAGICHIVGAGPGDPDLLTLRAAQFLQEADAILHDDLVPPAILARARREAELVSVGKRKGRPSWRQADIDAELVRRVRSGQTVVRLKAGDPFVFGRGGEELEALRDAGLPYTIVPGITAALGVAAAAGIPLTHRRLASSLTFMTGHAAAEGGAGHTYAIYMGASEAAAVRDRLLAQGVASATPVAIVENGTRPDQRLTTGTLADLARLAVRHTTGPGAGPSLILVGDVAAFAETPEEPLAEVA